MTPPSIKSSTKKERLDFIKEKFRCIASCENCGNCTILHRQAAELVFNDYIEGHRTYQDIIKGLRG